MKRAQLIAEIEQLDHQLALRIDIVHLSGALVQHQLGRIPRRCWLAAVRWPGH